MQLRKALRRAARNAQRDGTMKLIKVDDFNPVAPKGLELVSVTIISESNMVTNYAKRAN